MAFSKGLLCTGSPQGLPGILGSLQGMEVGTSGQGRAAYALTILLLGQGRCELA